jgi:hypothetical protein
MRSQGLYQPRTHHIREENTLAKVIIENATVENLLGQKGYTVSVSSKDAAGSEKKIYYKIWSSETQLQGAKLDKITGDLSVRLEEYTDKNGQPKSVAAIHVNNPLIESADLPF